MRCNRLGRHHDLVAEEQVLAFLFSGCTRSLARPKYFVRSDASDVWICSERYWECCWAHRLSGRLLRLEGSPSEAGEALGSPADCDFCFSPHDAEIFHVLGSRNSQHGHDASELIAALTKSGSLQEALSMGGRVLLRVASLCT